ncbi:hypothetical protein [Streptomyces daliensis]|uniref:Uncharacterized protein n=1 Tax=Streptomyces daliensis TaxID=299421 RepID=A0A8T4IYQ0_9ACTN|nr:hypothetical protein [Streptomyces daliensis]
MSAHRRLLVTAAAAGAVLFALWFVPSAKATPDHAAASATSSTVSSASTTRTDHAEAAGTGGAASQSRLADTGGFEAAPYMLGGLGFVGAGGALVVRSLRRA